MTAAATDPTDPIDPTDLSDPTRRPARFLMLETLPYW
jgi:hypothetical protein